MFDFLRRTARLFVGRSNRPTALAGEVVQRTFEALRNPGPATQCVALDDFFTLPAGSVNDADRRAVMEAAVAALEIADPPMFTAERLGGFGDEVIAPLSELLTRTASADARFFAALTLLRLESRLGVPVLVQEVEQERRYRFAASGELARAGCADHVPFVIDQLRRAPLPSGERFPTDDDEHSLGLLRGLSALQAPLPEDLRRKFSSPQASQYFRSIVEKYGFGESTA